MEKMFGDIGKYTGSEKKIIEFILTNTDEFLFLSIVNVAEELDISVATVSRFAKHAGFSDFKELKRNIMESYSKDSDVNAASKMGRMISKSDEFDLKLWLRSQLYNIEKTIEKISEEDFYGAVDAVCQAKKIHIHGKSASSPYASLLYYRLRRMGFTVNLIPSGGSEIAEGLVQVEEDDCIIFFSFTSLSRESRVVLDRARDVGVPSIRFTSRLKFTDDEMADFNIFAYRGEEKEYHAMTSVAALVDGFVVALAEESVKRSMQTLRQIKEIKRSYREQK